MNLLTRKTGFPKLRMLLGHFCLVLELEVVKYIFLVVDLIVHCAFKMGTGIDL